MPRRRLTLFFKGLMHREFMIDKYHGGRNVVA
jgi:hypothetical protein